MKINALSLSGWGQSATSLERIFSNIISNRNYIDINYYDYSSQDFDSLCYSLSKLRNIDFAIGWSLGGQLIIRLIANKIIKVSKLILIASPFQMTKNTINLNQFNILQDIDNVIADVNNYQSKLINNKNNNLADNIADNNIKKISNRITAAMPINKFIKFYYDFYHNPNKTLREFAFLTAMNDINKDKIIADLDINHNNLNNWLYWLAELGSFSCNDIDFLQIPETIIFHGFGDMVVHHSQANLFGNNIKKCHINFIDNCGHAPHIAHCNKIADSIKEFVLN